MKKFYNLVCIGIFIYVTLALGYRLRESSRQETRWRELPSAVHRLIEDKHREGK